MNLHYFDVWRRRQRSFGRCGYARLVRDFAWICGALFGVNALVGVGKRPDGFNLKLLNGQPSVRPTNSLYYFDNEPWFVSGSVVWGARASAWLEAPVDRRFAHVWNGGIIGKFLNSWLNGGWTWSAALPRVSRPPQSVPELTALASGQRVACGWQFEKQSWWECSRMAAIDGDGLVCRDVWHVFEMLQLFVLFQVVLSGVASLADITHVTLSVDVMPLHMASQRWFWKKVLQEVVSARG